MHAGINCFHIGMFVTHGHRVSNGCSQGSSEALLEALFLLLQQLLDVLILHKGRQRSVSSTDQGVYEQTLQRFSVSMQRIALCHRIDSQCLSLVASEPYSNSGGRSISISSK